DTRSLWAFSGPVALNAAYSLFVTNVDMLVAKRYLPEGDSGLYGAASTLTRILYLACTPILLLLFPRIASLSAQGRSPRRLAFFALLLCGVPLCASLIVPWLWADEVLQLVFGKGYAGGGTIVRVLWVAQCLLILQGLCTSVLQG